jgi:hypothetical protein
MIKLNSKNKKEMYSCIKFIINYWIFYNIEIILFFLKNNDALSLYRNKKISIILFLTFRICG